jgi:WD40 repeat protein
MWNHQRQSAAVEQTLTGHTDRVNSVAVLGVNRIVSAASDRTLKVWNLTTGQTEQTLIGHTDRVLGVAVVDE